MEAWLGIAGVVVGFLLGEGSRWARERLNVRGIKRAIKEELGTILGQIDEKKDMLNQAIRALAQSQVLPLESLPVSSRIYDLSISRIAPDLSRAERNCLYAIHGRLRVYDRLLDSFEERVKRDIQMNVMTDPLAVHSTWLSSFVEDYDLVVSLVDGYLGGKPKDVWPSG